MRSRLGEAGILNDDTRALVVFEEHGRRYRAENPDRIQVLRYRVDGGLITEGERCDFLMGLPARRGVYFVELKGANLKRAVRQILATINCLHRRLASFHLHARIVLTRLQRPAVRPAIVLRLERMLAQRGGRLKCASRLLVERIE
jgi:hypothetical protein